MSITPEQFTNDWNASDSWERWNWLSAMAGSEMAKRIRNVRLLAEKDTPEGFYWSERCPR